MQRSALLQVRCTCDIMLEGAMANIWITGEPQARRLAFPHIFELSTARFYRINYTCTLQRKFYRLPFDLFSYSTGASLTDVTIGLYLNRISAVDENNEVILLWIFIEQTFFGWTEYATRSCFHFQSSEKWSPQQSRPNGPSINLCSIQTFANSDSYFSGYFSPRFRKYLSMCFYKSFGKTSASTLKTVPSTKSTVNWK